MRNCAEYVVAVAKTQGMLHVSVTIAKCGRWCVMPAYGLHAARLYVGVQQGC